MCWLGTSRLFRKSKIGFMLHVGNVIKVWTRMSLIVLVLMIASLGSVQSEKRMDVVMSTTCTSLLICPI